MGYKVILSDLFLSDIQEIVEYLAEVSGCETASRIGNELLDRAFEAGQSPFIGQPVKQRPGARKVLRYPYLIYYDVDESRKTVEVLRAWHGARDPKTLRLSI
ncbi:MAG: type II toxin-antitoxin system RelE/ParE family toxin [Terrimicrobiaceae bacterium]